MSQHHVLNDPVRLRNTPRVTDQKTYPYSIVSRKIHMVAVIIGFSI